MYLKITRIEGAFGTLYTRGIRGSLRSLNCKFAFPRFFFLKKIFDMNFFGNFEIFEKMKKFEKIEKFSKKIFFTRKKKIFFLVQSKFFFPKPSPTQG